MSPPVLQTARLKLRGHRIEDISALAAMWADPTVTQYIGGTPATSEESWTRLLRYIGHWTLMGFGYWAIEQKETARYIGEAGFADHRRIFASDLKHLPEIGWVIAPEFQGRGYGTEAVRAVLAWGDTRLRQSRTTCLIEPDNLASIRIAQKFGYIEHQQTVCQGRPEKVFVR